jgi:hypothetical protein
MQAGAANAPAAARLWSRIAVAGERTSIAQGAGAGPIFFAILERFPVRRLLI